MQLLGDGSPSVAGGAGAVCRHADRAGMRPVARHIRQLRSLAGRNNRRRCDADSDRPANACASAGSRRLPAVSGILMRFQDTIAAYAIWIGAAILVVAILTGCGVQDVSAPSATGSRVLASATPQPEAASTQPE